MFVQDTQIQQMNQEIESAQRLCYGRQEQLEQTNNELGEASQINDMAQIAHYIT